ncbi:MAG: serine hydrolase [Chloroflexota bacterium]|nr:serine hydrolase [Chloroflexota bacterium]
MRRLIAGRALIVVLALIVAACAVLDDTPSPQPTAEPADTPPAVATLPPPATASPPGTSSPVTPTEPATPSPPQPTPRRAPSDAQLAPVLQALLDEWRVQSATPGAVVGVRLADGRAAVVASGVTDEDEGTPVAAEDSFRIGSITKTFVAVVVLQLAAAGEVDLDERLVAYLPDAPHAMQVTVRDLLAHTSGIADFAAERVYRQAVLLAPAHRWEPEEVVELVADRPLAFAPGERWAYSNTNYLLLGLLGEEVTGRPLATLIREGISLPLGLADTYLEEMEDAPPVETTGHHDLNGDGVTDSLAGIPYTALVTSGAAAGGLSSTALDVLDFAGGLFGDELLGTDWLEEMLTPPAVYPSYGLGIASFSTPEGDAWGHAGELPGYSTLFAHSSEARVTVVALANRSGAGVDELVRRVVGELRRDE